jgi:hypothetical protein
MVIDQSRDNGWVALRRNLFGHIEDGRLSMCEGMVLIALIGLASSGTGKTLTCASALRRFFNCGKELDDREMRRILDRLDKGGYIHRDLVHGQRGLYEVTINKYLISTGPNKKKLVTVPVKTTPKKRREMPGRIPGDARDNGPENALRKKSGSAFESMGSSSQEKEFCRETPVRIPSDALENGREKPTIQQGDPDERKRLETETVVVVWAPTQEKVEEDSLFSSNGEVLDGDHDSYSMSQDMVSATDPDSSIHLSQKPVEQETSAADHASVARVQVQGREQLVFINPVEPIGSKEHAGEGPPRAAAPAPEDDQQYLPDDADALVSFFFELTGSQAQLRDSLPGWRTIALDLLKDNSLPDIQGAAEFGIKKPFWRSLFTRDGDPFARFQGAYKKTLRKQYIDDRAAHAASAQDNRLTKEAHNGRSKKSHKDDVVDHNAATLAARQARRSQGHP